MRSYDDTGVIFPTMKPLDLPKKENTKVDAAPAEAKKEEVIDFSKVEIEPLFKDFVDFETFSKSTSAPSRSSPAKRSKSPKNS